jgi:6-phosphogluconolactonase
MLSEPSDPPVLEPVPGSPFSISYPRAVAFSHDGRLLAVTNAAPGSTAVSVFAVTGGGGLSPVPGSPFATDINPIAVDFGRRSRLLAVSGPGGMWVYSVDQTGQLTPAPGSPHREVENPGWLGFSPNGALLCAVDSASGFAFLFTVGRDGALTPSPGSPYAVGWEPQGAGFSADGSLLAVASRRNQSVNLFTVALGGVLTAGGSALAGPAPYATAFSPVARILAVAGNESDEAGQVDIFSVDAGPDPLRPVAGSPFACGPGPMAVQFAPSGDLLVTADYSSGTVSVFFVGDDGTLTPARGERFPSGRSPYDAAFSPDGTLLAVPNLDGGTLSVYAVASPAAG